MAHRQLQRVLETVHQLPADANLTELLALVQHQLDHVEQRHLITALLRDIAMMIAQLHQQVEPLDPALPYLLDFDLARAAVRALFSDVTRQNDPDIPALDPQRTAALTDALAAALQRAVAVAEIYELDEHSRNRLTSARQWALLISAVLR